MFPRLVRFQPRNWRSSRVNVHSWSGASLWKNSKRLLIWSNWLFLSSHTQADRLLMGRTAFKHGPVSWEWWGQWHSCRTRCYSSHTRAYPSVQYPLVSKPHRHSLFIVFSFLIFLYSSSVLCPSPNTAACNQSWLRPPSRFLACSCFGVLGQ